MKKSIVVIMLFFTALAVSGCSSILEGRSQEIVINTNPAGASCSLVRKDMPIGTVSPTPGAVYIEKTKYDIIIKCNKEGYQEATYFNKSGAASATFGNIVAGGFIGWGIDSATGADNKYDSPVNLTLAPANYASTGSGLEEKADWPNKESSVKPNQHKTSHAENLQQPIKNIRTHASE